MQHAQLSAWLCAAASKHVQVDIKDLECKVKVNKNKLYGRPAIQAKC